LLLIFCKPGFLSNKIDSTFCTPGSSAARLDASLVKIIPGVGTVIGELSMPVLSGASAYALGNVVAKHFHDGGTLEDFDLSSAQKRYTESVEEGKQVVNEIKTQEPTSDDTEATIIKINKLAEMRDAGILTEEEFTKMKTKLIF
jgi:hypothetical protein